MKLDILLEGENKQGIIQLKNYLENAGIEGLENTEINRAVHGDGQMGAGDILSSICAIITAAEKPLVELVVCLQKFVDNFRTNIKISDGKGGTIEINHGRSMKPDQVKELIKSIQQNTN
jgi:hypothetical protein